MIPCVLRDVLLAMLLRVMLSLCVIGLQAGCLQAESAICGNGGVCPPRLRCANIGDAKTCILLTSGNGMLDPGEACDDGNTRSGDGCPADCTPPCGDGVLDPGEACDDGNTLDGDRCSADCRTLDSIFLVSPQVVKFTATEGDPLPGSITVTVHLAYRGDAVLVGYAPGVPQPNWLSFATGPATENTAAFALQVLDTSVAGQRSTSVRFVVSHLNSTGLDTFDLPVTYSVDPSDLGVETTPATLAFAAPAGGVVPPSQAVSVAFNGASIMVTAAPSWVTVIAPPARATSPVSLVVSVNNTAFPAGTTLSADIQLGTTRGPSSGQPPSTSTTSSSRSYPRSGLSRRISASPVEAAHCTYAAAASRRQAARSRSALATASSAPCSRTAIPRSR